MFDSDYIPFPKPILTDDTATIRRAAVSYCQVCARDFRSPELVYYAPIDGNIVCLECAQVHKDRQLRIFVKEGIEMPKECPLCSCETNELINIEKHGVYIANPDGSVGERVTEACPDCGEVDNISVVRGCIFPTLPVPNHSAECGNCGAAWTVD